MIMIMSMITSFLIMTSCEDPQFTPRSRRSSTTFDPNNANGNINDLNKSCL